MKILIVDDNAEERYLLKMNLVRNGCEVIEAGDGAAGLHLANTTNPDMIISDALMPVMDGFQFLRCVKRDKTLRFIPFVFYSAVYTGDYEAKLARSLGAEAYIIKPREPEEFWTELQEVIENCKRNKDTVVSQSLIESESEFLDQYSHVVATKLEEKVRELEAANVLIGQKEQDWRETFNSISDCVSVHDTDYNILLTNRACEKLFGISQEEIRSKKCCELFHGADKPHQDCPTQIVIQTGQTTETEFFEPFLGCWLSVSCFPIFEENGKVRGVVHFARNISRRKNMEKALEQSEARFQSTFEQAAVGIAHLSSDGHWLKVNQKLCDIVGYTREELLSMSFQEITHPDDLKIDLQFVQQMLAGEIETYSLEKRYFHKDGSLVWINLTVSLVHDDQGDPDHFISVIEDISERKKLEAQLLQSQKMEAIGTLAGGVAHDFNNILTAIMGYGSLSLMKMPADDPQRSNINEMLAAAERAAHLTRDLLLFSRKQMGARKIVALNEIISKVEKFLIRVIGEDVECKFIFQGGPITIAADAHQLEQVLINLATNARDAMPGGGVFTVTTELVMLDNEYIAAHGYGKPGRYALLTASDSGQGMDAETQKRIFDPFFTTKEVGKGTGLGLSVVYGIIKQHDGYINVYSEPGMGTTFRIYLPTTLATPDEIPLAEQEEAPVGGSETILLAEDDQAVRTLTKTALTEYGYTVIEAQNGEEAVQKFRENRESIQLLLFDLIMPKKNGKEAYEEIRKIEPDIKVLFASGYAPENIQQKVLLDENTKLIVKPVSTLKLLRMVRSVLDGDA